MLLKETYEELLNKREEILNQIRLMSENAENSLLEKVKKHWVEHCPSETTMSKVLAIDGGMWIKELRYGSVYVINAEIVKAEGLNVNSLDSKAIVGVLKPGNRARERVSLIMQLLELKLALKHANEGDFILFDGSLTKKIGNYNWNSRITILDDVNITEDKIYSLEEKDEELMYKYLIAENQLAIAFLIENYKDKLIWVSKNSKSTELFKESFSDITLIDSFTQSCGYTLPLEKTIKGENLLSEKAYKVLNGLKYYSSYIRLKEGEKTLKVDLFSNSSINNVFNILHTINVRGYPYPLLQVHADVRISKQDRERIQNLLYIRKRNIEWWPNQLF